MFENFYSPEEVAEMLKAGRNLCSQAPKEERKIFSTTDPECSQVLINDHKIISCEPQLFHSSILEP